MIVGLLDEMRYHLGGEYHIARDVDGMIDMDGGGRLYLDFTDCELENLKVGSSVEMTFRRKYMDENRGIHGYFWKAIPV